MIEVEAAAAVDDELCAAVEALVPQLSRSSPAPSRAALERIVAGEATTLFVVRHDGRVVGVLTLVAFEIPTGVRALIEDVVVDESARGAGAGAALVEAALGARGLSGRPHGGSDLAPKSGRGQPSLRADGIRGAPDQRLPLHHEQLSERAVPPAPSRQVFAGRAGSGTDERDTRLIGATETLPPGVLAG